MSTDNRFSSQGPEGSASRYRTPIDWLLPPVPEPAFERGKVALVLVDLQLSDAHPDHGLGRRAREHGRADLLAGYFARVAEIVPRVQRLLGGFRATGLDIVHVRLAGLAPDGRDVNRGLRLRDSVPRLGSAEAEFLPEVAPRQDELVLNKTSMSAFTSTAIDGVLRNLGIETIVTAGVVTNGCVELTARDAADRGYSVVLVGDACTAGTVELHENALERMATSAVGLISVWSTEAVRRRLGSLTPRLAAGEARS